MTSVPAGGTAADHAAAIRRALLPSTVGSIQRRHFSLAEEALAALLAALEAETRRADEWEKAYVEVSANLVRETLARAEALRERDALAVRLADCKEAFRD